MIWLIVLLGISNLMALVWNWFLRRTLIQAIRDTNKVLMSHRLGIITLDQYTQELRGALAFQVATKGKSN